MRILPFLLERQRYQFSVYYLERNIFSISALSERINFFSFSTTVLYHFLEPRALSREILRFYARRLRVGPRIKYTRPLESEVATRKGRRHFDTNLSNQEGDAMEHKCCRSNASAGIRARTYVGAM